jgi:hypothetical protein
LGMRRPKHYFCTVVSEDVQVGLKNRPSFGPEPRSERYVQCNQLEYQYVGLNQPPCPLSLDLFAEEIKKRRTNEEIEEWKAPTNG